MIRNQASFNTNGSCDGAERQWNEDCGKCSALTLQHGEGRDALYCNTYTLTVVFSLTLNVNAEVYFYLYLLTSAENYIIYNVI